MPRYQGTKVKNRNVSTKEPASYKTTYYMEVPEEDTDMYFVTQPGDRLDILAHRFYGDPSLWWFIARINNLNSINVEPGISIRVPTTTKYAKGT